MQEHSLNCVIPQWKLSANTMEEKRPTPEYMEKKTQFPRMSIPKVCESNIVTNNKLSRNGPFNGNSEYSGPMTLNWMEFTCQSKICTPIY